jgi:replicative DNA helicase
VSPPTIPHDIAAEQSVLGGILLRPEECLAMLPRDFEVDDFYDPRHRAVFSAMRNLEAAMRPIDPTTLGDELDKFGKLEPIGGYAFLGELALRVPTPENVAHYAAIVRRHRVTRDVMLAASDLLDRCGRGEVAGEDAVNEMATRAQRIETGAVDRGRTMAQLMRAELEAMDRDCERVARGEVVAGMPTGILELDSLIGGTPFGLVTVVAARPGEGKTSISLTFAAAAADLGNDDCLTYSYEDSGASYAQRKLASLSGVPTQRIATRNVSGEEVRMLAAATPRAMRRSDWVIPARGMTVDDLVRDVRARRRRARARGQARSVGRRVQVDFLQAMPFPRTAARGMSKNDLIGETMKRLVDLAAIEEVSVVVYSQLNREVEKRDVRVPRLSDLRDSGEIEADAKVVLGLYRPAKHGAAPTAALDGAMRAGPKPGVAPEHLLEVHVLKYFQGQDSCHARAYWHLPTHDIGNVPRDDLFA